MKNIHIAFLSIFMASCASTPAFSGTLYPLTSKCETALALSGGPAYMRVGAGVYVLGVEGYEATKDATNGYVCMVQRNSDHSLLPQCFDKIGQQAQMKVHLDEGRKLRAGVSWEQIRKERASGFASGIYTPPSGPGVVYMASDYNLSVSQDGKTRRKIAPHVMYHAPDVTMDDIASDQMAAMENPGMPFIVSPGPMGYMISFVERATDSTDVVANCSGQLPDPDTFDPILPN